MFWCGGSYAYAPGAGPRLLWTGSATSACLPRSAHWGRMSLGQLVGGAAWKTWVMSIDWLIVEHINMRMVVMVDWLRNINWSATGDFLFCFMVKNVLSRGQFIKKIAPAAHHFSIANSFIYLYIFASKESISIKGTFIYSWPKSPGFQEGGWRENIYQLRMA